MRRSAGAWPAALAALLLYGMAAGAQPPPDEPVAPAPAPLRADQVEAFVAPLTDRQTRALLIDSLQQAALAETGEPAGPGDLLEAITRSSDALAERLARTHAALGEADRHFAGVLNLLTDYGGWPVLGRTTLILLLVLALGFAVERLVGLLTRGLPERIAALDATGLAARAGLLALRLALSLTGLAAFTVTAYGATFAFFERFDPLRVYVSTVVLAIAATRLALALAQFLLAPRASRLRLLAMDDADARALQRFCAALAAVASFGFLGVSLLALLGLPAALYLPLRIAVGLVLTLMLVGLVWRSRRRVAAAPARSSALAQTLAQSWHLLVSAYLLLSWLAWSVNVLLARFDAADAAAAGLLLVLLLPLVDRGVRYVLGVAFGLEREPEAARREEIAGTVRRIGSGVRAALVVAAVVILAEAWAGLVTRMLASAVGAAVLHGVFNIAVSTLVAWMVWQALRLAIDRHLPADDEPAAIALDEDAQRAPATRAQTLLPLARTAALIVLVTMVGMIALSSLGVNIGPLLAGAGVVGLAVGFGAQKLVQDMISGIFFLVDDAFRVGEYVEAGGMKGTVEAISLRSMRLRHHRGPVQTVPYSEIQAVRNHSRDWVIMKLELRLPYETDVEKVRKIIKKVGQQMLDDEELGPSFLQPLKSQGVFRMEESALIVRMKFTAHPNQQWVLRREAFRRVQQALLDAGIRFAHREVTVHVKPGAGVDEDVAQGAAAAALEGPSDAPPAGADTR